MFNVSDSNSKLSTLRAKLWFNGDVATVFAKATHEKFEDVCTKYNVSVGSWVKSAAGVRPARRKAAPSIKDGSCVVEQETAE